MKKSVFAIAVAAVLSGCGGSDGGSGGGTPTPSYEINDKFVQDSIYFTQGDLFLTGTFNTESLFWEHGNIFPNDPVYRYDGEYGARCNAGACAESNGLTPEDAQEVVNSLDAMGIADGATIRYRTADEVNGVDQHNPVDSDGQSRLQTVMINVNDQLTPERRQLILDAVAQIQEDAGVQLFNDEIVEIDMSHISVDDYVEDLSAHIPEYKYQNENTWRGVTYNDDGTHKYNPDTATDEYGDPTKSDSYEKIIAEHGVRGGVIISYGTGMATTGADSCKMYKANVSGFPFVGNGLGHIVDKNAYITNKNFHWVNLGQHTQYCQNLHYIDKETIVHELAHAVGLHGHFEGFGIGGVWDDRAKAVLRSLYNTPVGTPYDQMTVVE
ncbi:hypothetical protein [Vibrio crassostreae]|uniref:hypothetical protein n=1 Tax=Vibrio crassostreae TaxID=246167 RepID=UPI001B3057DE|nr:hypothetical protein [Vibrio crassostreae]